MNFLDAVLALKEGRCAGIKSITAEYIYSDSGGYLRFDPTGEIRGPSRLSTLLADDWQLVNEKPVYREETITRWAIADDGGNIGQTYRTEAAANEALTDYLKNAKYADRQVIKLTGVQKIEVKPKVLHREEIEVSLVKLMTIAKNDSLRINHNAKIFAEWES